MPPLSAGALADAVAALAAHPVRRREFGAAGRAMVLGRSWHAVGDELIAYYAAVLGTVSVPRVAVARGW